MSKLCPFQYISSKSSLSISATLLVSFFFFINKIWIYRGWVDDFTREGPESLSQSQLLSWSLFFFSFNFMFLIKFGFIWIALKILEERGPRYKVKWAHEEEKTQILVRDSGEEEKRRWGRWDRFHVVERACYYKIFNLL